MSNAEPARVEPNISLVPSDDERRQQYIGRGWWASIPLTIVPARWLSGGEMRLDAGYYAETVAAAMRIVQDSGLTVEPLSQLVSRLYYPNRFKRVYARSRADGVPFLTASEMLQFRPVSDEFLARKSNAVEVCTVAPQTLLITRSGTVGRCVIAGKRLSAFAITDDAIRVQSQKVPVGYLYTVLSTWVGRALVAKDKYGSAIKHLEPHHLAGIPIPLLPEDEQQEIDNAIQRAYALRDKANELLDEADEMLHSELGLPRFDESLVPYLPVPAQSEKAPVEMPHPKAFTLPVSDLYERFDSSFHNPLARTAIGVLLDGKFPLKSLSSISADIDVAPRFKRIYVPKEHGIPFLQGSHLPQMRPLDVKYLSRSQQRGIERWIIRKNWVLITCSGTIGRIGLVTAGQDGWAASQHLLRIIPDYSKAHPGYLTAFLMTPYGQHQITSKTYGGVVDEITEDDTGAIFIPDAPASLQSAIGQLVVSAFEKKDEASALEENTIRRCEEAFMNTDNQTIKTGQKSEEPESEANRFRSFVKQVMSVPKSEIDKREAEYQAQKTAKKEPPK